MLTVILNLLKNPTVLVGVVMTAIIGYLYIVNTNLEATVAKRDSSIVILRSNIDTLTRNISTCSKLNATNFEIIEKYRVDTDKIKKYCDDSVKDKNVIISRLRKEIVELKKPIHYEETLQYTDCTVKVKTKDDNEDSTFNIITNIGN